MLTSLKKQGTGNFPKHYITAFIVMCCEFHPYQIVLMM